MKVGKAAEAVLKRSVLGAVKQQGQQNKVSNAGVGKDAGLFDIPQQTELLAMSCAVHCGTEPQAAPLVVHRACNSLAAAGALPAFITAQLTLPESAEESELKHLMAQLLEACHKAGVTLAQGHTEISKNVLAPVISVTALGTAVCPRQEEASRRGVCQEEVSGEAEPREKALSRKQGMALVMTKYAGLAGTALLASAYRAELQKRYPSFLLDKAEALYNMVSVQPEAKLAAALGVTAMHDVAEGGVFGAVWELAEREHIGLAVDLRKIPIRQETVELCEFFDINPYQLKGDGALLLLTDNSIRLLSAFEEAGIPAEVIGMVTDNNDRILKNEDETRYLEPNRVDEYEKASGSRCEGSEKIHLTGASGTLNKGAESCERKF